MSGGEVGEAWYNILDNVSKIIFYYFCYIGPLRDIFKYLNYEKDVILIFRSLVGKLRWAWQKCAETCGTGKLRTQKDLLEIRIDIMFREIV